MEGEVGPGTFGRRGWHWLATGVFGDGLGHNLTSEFEAWFVGVVERGDEVVAGKVAG